MQQALYINSVAGARMRVALTTAIYRKVIFHFSYFDWAILDLDIILRRFNSSRPSDANMWQ